jgi:HEAT repeat protein
MRTKNLCKRFIVLVLFLCTLSNLDNSAAADTGADVAWKLIHSGLQSSSTEERIVALRVLGLLVNDRQAADLAEDALTDSKPEIRSTAATALGQMHSTASIPKLKQALNDKEIPVILAAARALHEMKDPAGFEIYYEILTGERKGSEGLIAQQTAVLHDPKKLAKLTFEQGIDFIPYASIGWNALRVILKNDASPIRAAAATMLTHDPDPKSAAALVNATRDKHWIVRVAALEAVAKRGDSSLRIKIEPSMYDVKREVRYTAAATVLHLLDAEGVGNELKPAEASRK